MDNNRIDRIVYARYCKNSFKELSTRVLGYKDIGAFHDRELLNIAQLRLINDQPTRRLWLWARGHFKTSLITEAHSIYLILNNPNIRILIVSNTMDIAKTMLKNIKGHLMFNNLFRSLYPEFCPKATEDGKIEFGTTEHFTVPNRTKNLKEPTVMCAGVGTNLTGLHFDYMKIDDLVTKDSVSNDTQIKASKDYYASLRQLFDNPTVPREDIIGTIYHFNDLHRDMQKAMEFKKSFIPVATDMTFKDITFPERFSEQGIRDILNDPTIGPYVFSAQYMLNPINPTEIKFKEEWLDSYSTHPDLAEYICVDPASTQKKKSDYTVIERWGVDFEGFHYLLEGVRDKLTAAQRIEKLFEVVSHANNLKYVKYEVLGGRHGDLEAIKEKMRFKRVFFSLKETKATTAAKQDRIEQRLIGPFNAKTIKFPNNLYFKSLYDGKTYDFVQLYKLEYLQFPFTEHDDILDCHSQMFEEPLMRGKKKDAPQKDDAFEWWRKMAIDSKKHTLKDYIYGQKGQGKVVIPAKISWR